MTNNNNLYKMLTSEKEDDYTSFIVYLRKNDVWKVVRKVFRILYETRPEDPIEVFRANVMTNNIDNRNVKHMCQQIAKADKKISILKRDKLILTARLDSLGKKICDSQNSESSFRSTVDYTEDNDSTTTLYDSDHV